MSKKNNHYVQQCYLNRFLDMRVKPPRKPSIWVYDKETGKSRLKGTKNVGYVPHLYSLKLVDGRTTHAIEDWFNNNIENPNRKVFQKIINQTPINDEERLLFSHYLYFAFARVPNFLNYMNWFYRNGQQRMEEVGALFNIEKTEKLVEATSLTSDISTLELMIETSGIFVPIINEMHWQFLLAPESKHFVTSDNPLILNDPNLRKIMPSFIGWMNPNIQLTYPISSKICMRATWKKKRKCYIKADMQFLRAVNFRTSFYATRYIFSSRPIQPPPIEGTFEFNKADTFIPEN